MIKNSLKIHFKIKPDMLEDFLLNISTNTKSTFNHFGTINKKTVKQIVKNEVDRKDKIKFFAVIDNKLIGYGFLTKFSKTTKKHNCILGIVVLDSFQKVGIGKKICENMITKAWEKGLTKIWLNVFYDNLRAYNLYKSLGFQVEGIFLDDENNMGKKRHVISMALIKNKNPNFSYRVNLLKKLDNNKNQQ